jgi:diacylglycerol kinase (ATP)
MQIPVILNPTARSMRAGSLEQSIRALSPAPELHLTRSAEDAERLAFELAGQGHSTIAAAGGDGTVNKVIHGLARHNAAIADPSKHAALGILPVGTMNVLAHELKIPSRDLGAAWPHVVSGARRQIDLWCANEFYFAQLGGVGLDAQIVEATTPEMKNRFGPLSYAISAISVLSKEAPSLSVHLENRPALHGSILVVGNGRHYGGPVPVFPNARNDDGLLDLILFRQRGPWEVLQFLHAVTRGDFSQCEDIDYLQAREFRVESNETVPFEVDGELAKNAPVHFKPAPFKLQVAVLN